MPSLLSASFWSFVLNWGQQGIAAIVTFLLAAVLGPEKYGLAIIAISFVLLLQSVLDQGLLVALIQRQDLDDDNLNSVFWALIAFAVLSTGLILHGANLWADWNQSVELTSLVWALSPIVTLKCLYLVPHALLRRELNFKRLAMINNLALIFAGFVAILSLANGLGIWSLILYYLTLEFANAIFYWTMTRYRPAFFFSSSKLMVLLPVASGGFAAGLGSFARSRGDIFVLGVLLGPAAVGLFRLALRIQELLLTLFTRPISMVALPAIARSAQDPTQRRKSASDFLLLSTGLTIPVMAFVAGISPYILGLLGQNWQVAAPSLSILCVLGALNSALFLVPQYLNALGKTWLSAIWFWLTSVTTLVLMVPFIQVFAGQLEATSDQLSALAFYLLVINLIVSLPSGSILLRQTFKLPSLFLCSGLLRPCASGILVYAIVKISDEFLTSRVILHDEYNSLLSLIALITIGGLATLASIYLLNRNFYDEVAPRLFSIARSALQRIV